VQREIEQLERELGEKDQLLASYDTSLRAWKAKLTTAQLENEDVLSDEFSSTSPSSSSSGSA
jgi:hypothetical protein